MYQKEYQLWVESVKEEYLKEQLEKMTDEEKELLIWSNCGEREEIDWNMLFDTDKKYYVGMVKFQ